MGSPIRGGAVAGVLLAAAVAAVVALPGSAGAQVFSPTRSLTTTAAGYQEPQVSALGGDVHVAWVDAATGSGDVYYRRSTDGGATFGPVLELTSYPEGGLRLAAGVRLVWTEGYFGERDVYTRATSGFGLTLGAAENLSRTAGDSGEASIASARCGTQSHVVWLEGGEAGISVRYRRASLPFTPFACVLLPEAR